MSTVDGETERNPYELSPEEHYLVYRAPEEIIEDFATSRDVFPGSFVDAIRIALLAMQRWGEDLARGAGTQRYSAFEDVLTEAQAAVGVARGVIHETPGTPIDERAETVVEILEDENDVSRHDLVGGVVERIPACELPETDVKDEEADS